MDSSPLYRLPAELRDIVYELVLCINGAILIHVPPGTSRTVYSSTTSHALGLLAACKRAYRSSPGVLLKQHFQGHDARSGSRRRSASHGFSQHALLRSRQWHDAVSQWYRRIGLKNFSRIPTVDINLGTWDVTQYGSSGSRLYRTLPSTEHLHMTTKALAQIS